MPGFPDRPACSVLSTRAPPHHSSTHRLSLLVSSQRATIFSISKPREPLTRTTSPGRSSRSRCVINSPALEPEGCHLQRSSAQSAASASAATIWASPPKVTTTSTTSPAPGDQPDVLPFGHLAEFPHFAEDGNRSLWEPTLRAGQAPRALRACWRYRCHRSGENRSVQASPAVGPGCWDRRTPEHLEMCIPSAWPTAIPANANWTA